MNRSNQAPALAVPPASDIAEEQPRTEYGRRLLRFLDEMPPEERAVIDELARMDRELGEPPSDE